MGKVTGFLEHPRENTPVRPIDERVKDWLEVQQDFSAEQAKSQGAR